jgi:hypothetical protein
MMWKRGYLFRLALLLGLVFISSVEGFSGTFSFTGTFAHDNDVQLFTFTLLSGGTVTLQTLGFGGSTDNTNGTNAAGQIIFPGGFESMLQVFDANTGNAIGGTLLPGPSPTCGLRTPDPNRNNFCQDDYGQQVLGPGIYLLALTQSANAPNGNLSDGFFYVDTVPDPNFNNGFVGTFGFQGNGNWAVDILGADSASVVGAVPEPAPAALIFATLMFLGSRSRRLRRA